MTPDIILTDYRRDPEAASAAYVGQDITCRVEAGYIHTWPNGISRMDTWYTYVQGKLSVRINVATIVHPRTDLSWIEQGQEVVITTRIVGIDHMALGTSLISVEPAREQG